MPSAFPTSLRSPFRRPAGPGAASHRTTSSTNTDIALRHRHHEPFISVSRPTGALARIASPRAAIPARHLGTSPPPPTVHPRSSCARRQSAMLAPHRLPHALFRFLHTTTFFVTNRKASAGHRATLPQIRSPPLRPLFCFRLGRLERLPSPAIGGLNTTPPPPPAACYLCLLVPHISWLIFFFKRKVSAPQYRPPIGCRRSLTPLKSRIFAAHAVAPALSSHTRCALLRPSSFKSSFSFCKIKRHRCRKRTPQHTTNKCKAQNKELDKARAKLRERLKRDIYICTANSLPQCPAPAQQASAAPCGETLKLFCKVSLYYP